MGEYLSRKFAPLPVTKGTRIAGGLFYDVELPMIVIGLLVTGDVVARVIGSHIVHVLKDVEWYDPPPHNAESRAYWAEIRRQNGL